MTTDTSGERLSRFGNIYVLCLLFTVNLVNYADRTLVAVLTQPMKLDLGLSDTQIGVISGIAFATMFSVSGLLLARFADRFSRTRLLGTAVGLWSLMCLLTAWAGSFWHLLALRLGLGIAESVAVPIAYALIYAAFPARTRSFAYGVFLAGATAGLATGVGVGGWLGHEIGWRQTMATIAIPGFLVALLVVSTVREPARPTVATASRRISEIVSELLRTPILVAMIAALSLTQVANAGFAQWAPAFYMRSHHMSLSELGPRLAISSAAGALIGLIAGGAVVDGVLAVNERRAILLCGLLNVLASAASAVAFLAGGQTVSLVAFALYGLMVGSAYAPTVSIFQRHAPDDARVLAAAIMMFFVINIGQGGGPFFIGLLSDRLTLGYGPAGLGLALLIGSVALLGSAASYIAASRVVPSGSGQD